MDVLVTLDAAPDERRAVEARLGTVAWAADGARAPDARVVLSMFPHKEMRAAGLRWEDLPEARLLQLVTAGANHVRWAEVPTRMQVATAPGATGPAIAEYVLGAVVAWARSFQRSTAAIRAGRFDMAAPVLALEGLPVGVVGHGGLGGAAARLLARMGCDVAAASRTGAGDDAHLAWLGTMDRLPELAARSQVLVVAVPHVRATEGLVDLALLERLRSPALLVNVARGPVVRQDDLYQWLEARPEERAAHLDVWWRYPQGSGHPWDLPFGRLPNVTMTPHNSASVPGYRQAMLETACGLVASFLRTGAARHVQDAADYR